MADPRLEVGPRIFGVYRGSLVSGFREYRASAPAQPIHAGWDIAAPTGTNIRALGRCEVVRVRDNDSVSGYHQEITVWYPSAMAYVLYGHVRRGIIHRVGDEIAQGDIIAQVGTSYDAMWTTPHLHAQCWKYWSQAAAYSNAAAIDPARVRRWYGGY